MSLLLIRAQDVAQLHLDSDLPTVLGGQRKVRFVRPVDLPLQL